MERNTVLKVGAPVVVTVTHGRHPLRRFRGRLLFVLACLWKELRSNGAEERVLLGNQRLTLNARLHDVIDCLEFSQNVPIESPVGRRLFSLMQDSPLTKEFAQRFNLSLQDVYLASWRRYYDLDHKPDGSKPAGCVARIGETYYRMALVRLAFPGAVKIVSYDRLELE